jgi:hypothetical protein
MCFLHVPVLGSTQNVAAYKQQKKTFIYILYHVNVNDDDDGGMRISLPPM